MKVVNLILGNSYNEGWGYQENLLSKWQKLNGNEVTIIASRMVNNKNDDGYHLADLETYTNDLGIKVIRIDYLFNNWAFRTLRLFKNTYKTIEQENPDFIFIHNGQFLDSLKVCKYLKNHPNCRAVVDNHADETNSAKTFFPKLLHYTIWKYCMNRLNKYVSKFYGVLPIRCDFLKKYYNLPANKIELLVMGVDDELVELSNKRIKYTKEKYNITNSSLNIVTGGKIDHYKTETLNLMAAVNQSKNTKLYIFGSVGDEIKVKFNSLLSENIKYVGWLNQEESYALLQSCDIAFFPGRHSVLWEQCVGLRVPLVVKNLPGTQHINVGGNCLFLDDCSIANISKTIVSFTNNDRISNMKDAYLHNNYSMFSYKNIALSSIPLK